MEPIYKNSLNITIILLFLTACVFTLFYLLDGAERTGPISKETISENKNLTEYGNLPIKLFYYNPKLDQGTGGLMCSEAGLVSVNRTIPKSDTIIEDTIKMLLEGEITEEERQGGVTSEFPLTELQLTNSFLVDGNLSLTFSDPQNKTGGGSCRVTILRNQIETTAKQFPEVKSVQFLPEELFQP